MTLYGAVLAQLDSGHLSGCLVDDAGHRRAHAVKSTDVAWLEHDLRRLAERVDPEARFVFAGHDRSTVPSPCRGCAACDPLRPKEPEWEPAAWGDDPRLGPLETTP